MTDSSELRILLKFLYLIDLLLIENEIRKFKNLKPNSCLNIEG